MNRSILLFGENSEALTALAAILDGRHGALIYTDRPALLAAVGETRALCLIADFADSAENPATLIEAIRSGGATRLPIIVVMGETNVRTAVETMRAGAIDLLEKPLSTTRLLEAIDKAVALEDAFHGRREVQMFRALSVREREVAVLIASGQTSRQAGEALGISPRTVDIYRGKLLRKLSVANVAALATLVGRASSR